MAERQISKADLNLWRDHLADQDFWISLVGSYERAMELLEEIAGLTALDAALPTETWDATRALVAEWRDEP